VLRTRAPLTIASPFDLHVLGPPQTFALSQDQTLQFELCSIMIEDSLEPSTGCRCRPAAFAAVHDPTGCGLEVHVPTSVMSWFPSSTIQFSGSVSRRPGPSRGGRLMLAHPFPSSFFLTGFSFQTRGDVRLASYIHREPGVPFCSCPTSVRKSASKSQLLARTLRPEAGGTGWLEGRRGLPRTLFPVKRLFAAKFSLRGSGRPEPPRRRSEG
jgi:hypothetical protein